MLWKELPRYSVCEDETRQWSINRNYQSRCTRVKAVFSMYTPTIVHITCPLGRLQLYCFPEVVLCLSFMTLIMRSHQNIHTCKKKNTHYKNKTKARWRWWFLYQCQIVDLYWCYVFKINKCCQVKQMQHNQTIVSLLFKSLKHGVEPHEDHLILHENLKGLIPLVNPVSTDQDWYSRLSSTDRNDCLQVAAVMS